MQQKNPTVNIEQIADTSRFTKRIGSVVYEVRVHFNKNAKEKMDEKILRLIKNDMEATS